MVGAGPAGLAGRPDRGPFRRPGGAARRPARARRVAARHRRADRRPPALEWVAAAVAELATFPEVRVLQRTTAFGYYDDNFVLARRTAHRPPRLRRPRAPVPAAGLAASGPGRSSLATGAHERPIVFADNDRPGVMLAGSGPHLPAPLRRAGRPAGRGVHHQRQRLPGRRGPRRRRASRSPPSSTPGRTAPARWAASCERRGIEVRTGQAVTGTSGTSTRRPGARRRAGRRPARGPRPASTATCCWSRAAGTPPCTCTARPAAGCRYDDALGAFLPGTDLDGVSVAGRRGRRFDLAECLATAPPCSRSALTACARCARARDAVTDDCGGRPVAHLWSVPDPAEQDCGRTQFVDLQRDVTVADMLRATGAGLRSVEHVKRYTTSGTAHDQGKTSGIISSGIVADALGVRIADLGTTTFRPPYTPVSFAALAGPRPRAPARPRAGHADARLARARRRQVRERRAVEAAVVLPARRARTWRPPCCAECRAARQSVAMMDASTLGKIEVRGPGRRAGCWTALYTNLISTLKVGSIRYGVMCGVDGMVVRRRHGDAPGRRPVPAHHDDRQRRRRSWTGWRSGCRPSGRTCGVWLHLGDRAVGHGRRWSGPRSRDVLAPGRPRPGRGQRRVPVHDLARRRRSPGCRRGSAGSASPASSRSRSTSAAWDGLDAVGGAAGGRGRLGITPYGTETMHVLRAEKGYPIIGQDTDGTVTPQDLGMAWVVSKKKADFIGKRSFARAANQRPDRKQLVGAAAGGARRAAARGRAARRRRRAAASRRCRCWAT